MRPEDESQYVTLLQTAKTPEEILSFVESRGMKMDRGDVEKWIAGREDYRKQGRDLPAYAVYKEGPKPLTDLGDGAAGASIRGFGAGTLAGALDEIGAGADTLGLTPGRENVWNSERRLADIWANNQHQNEAILGYDRSAHPWATLGGEVAGGLVVPFGAKARTVPQLFRVGAAYGGTQGFMGTEGSLGERAIGGAVGTLAGGVVGAGAGKALQYAPQLARYAYGRLGGRMAVPGNPADPAMPAIDAILAARQTPRMRDVIDIGDVPAPPPGAALDPVPPVDTAYPGPAGMRDRDWIDIADIPPPPHGSMAMDANAAASASRSSPLDLTADIPPEAIAHVERAQASWPDTMRRLTTGEAEVVENAAFNRELGFIDMRMGVPGDPANDFRGGYGLAHIIAKHGNENVVDDLPSRLAGMRIVERDPRHQDRLILEGQGGRAAVATTWHGDQQKWVLTAYDPQWKPPHGKTPPPMPIGGEPDSVHRRGMGNIGDTAPSGNVSRMDQTMTDAQRRALAEGIDPRDVLPIPSNMVDNADELAAIDKGRFAPARAPHERGELTQRRLHGYNGNEISHRGPVDLVGWLRLNGGLQDQGGELSHMGLTNRARSGDFVGQETRFGPLVNNGDGMNLDDAAMRAWEAGYFPDHPERPGVNEFLDALRDTHEGRNRRFLPEDFAEIDRYHGARQTRHDLEQQRFETGQPVYTDRSVPAGDERSFPPAQAYEEWPSGGPDFAGNINLSKLDSPQDIARALSMVDRRVGFDAATRGRVAHAETQRLAADLGMTPETLLSRRRGQAFNAEEALAARQILAKSGNELVNMARRVRAMNEPGEDVLADFRRAWVRHVAIQEQVSGMTAEAGRALQQFRQMADSRAVRKDVLSAMVRSGGGRENLQNAAQTLLDAVELEPGKFNAFTEKAIKPKWQGKVSELFINFLLSWPQTHTVNITSNALTTLAQIGEYGAAAAIGKVRQMLPRANTDRIIASEVGQRTFGLLQGAKEGARLFAHALRTGEPSDFISKVEGQDYKSISGIKGEIIRVPTRLLTAEDEFFKGVARRMELNGLAARQAHVEGLKGDAAARRIAELSANPTDEMLHAAQEYGRYLTFQQKLGPTAQSISQAANSNIALKFFLPFVRTPTNLLKFAVERSPAAPLLEEWRRDFVAGVARRDLAIAKMLVGTGFGAAMYEAAQSGLITGAAPSDPKKARMLYADGWKPYSIKIGDTYYSYSRLDPFSSTIGVAADLATLPQGMSERQREEKATLLVASIMGNLANKTWLSGVSDVVGALHDPERNADNMLQRLIGSLLVPNIVAGAARTLDPTQREVETLDDAIRSRIPGLRDDLLPRRNIWGEPIVNQGGIGPDFLSPMAVGTALNDPVNKAMLQLDYAPGYPSRKVGGRELTPEQYDRYVEMAGKASHSALGTLIADPRWQGLPDEDRAKAAKKIVDRVRDDVRAQLFGKDATGVAGGNDPWAGFKEVGGQNVLKPQTDAWAGFKQVQQPDLVGELQAAIPGVRFTSGYRTPEYQADMRRRGYNPSSNSAHLDGSALDMLPPPGKSMEWLKGQVRKLRPDARLLIHDGHLHATFPGYYGAPVLGGAAHAGIHNPNLSLPPLPPGTTLD
ncbi:MAG: hypothetical protein M0R03_18275 [Novosphingobium sp.]|nr:hypothetical protein [Novosphingobium sp.]